VPTQCVDAVRTARTPEELESLPLSKPETATWLLELATSPDHGDSLFDPDRLIVRTTLDHLLGYSEGCIRRLMLNLSDEQRRYVAMDSAGPIFLRGSAGSGKTTVAVYRAIRLAEQGQRVLVVTRNRTLAGATQSLIKELVGPLPAEISVDTLDKWLLTFLRSRGPHIQLVDAEERIQLLHEAVRDLRRENSHFARELDVPFLSDEIERVIKGQTITTEDAYLEVRRTGRRERLGKELRQETWAVFVSFQARLAAIGKVDFMDLPALAEAELVRMRLDPPFDSVIVDEAQDLTAVQLRVTRLLTRAATEDLMTAPVFMVGDVAQSLRSRGFSWREAGFRMNRSFSLMTNVRNSREIAAAANALLAHNQTVTEDVDYIVPKQSDKRGLRPIVLRSLRRDLEDPALRETILALLEGQTFRLSDIAILCRTNEGCRFYVDLLTRTDVPARHHKDAKFELLSDEVKVLTIDSAKGLEFPVVFIPRMHDDHYPYDHRDITDLDERQMAVDRDRTSLYVGMTRACEALYLVTSPQRPSRFLVDMDGYLWFDEFTTEAKRSH